MIGQILSHYKIIEELSRGGMGIVYRALDLKLDREVALKVLPPDLVADPERKRRFVQEAKSAAKLDHPHIGMVFEIDEADGVTFIAMELIQGEPLRDIIRRQKLPLTRAVELATEIAEGLARAHDKGIVHRDLKPANIMVTQEGHAKIIDFGLAKLVEPIGERDSEAVTDLKGGTDPGKVMGTASYMSPEQARGQTVNHRSDIFSFGIVLHEMLTGQPPFEGESGIDTLNAILSSPAPRLPAFGPQVPDEVTLEIQRIVDKCLAKDPGERYQTIKDTVVNFRVLRRRPESAQTVVVETPAKPRNKWRLGLAFTAFAAAILLAGYFTLVRGPTPEAETTTAAGPKRIVVLPFENLGPPEDAYFAAGMTEEITSRLAVVKGLGVISRNSALQYENSAKTTQQIAEELAVDYILEGTVRWQRAGDGSSHVRVTPQLIRTADDIHVWADNYDRIVDEVFEVQSDIAENVIQQLDVTLLDPERKVIETRPTENLEAYQAYLRGMASATGPGLLTDSAMRLQIEMFERAVELDPEFALAYARLSRAHSSLFFYGHDWTEARLAKAKMAADQAYEIDPELPEAHEALGWYYYWSGQDHQRALEEFALAERFLPNNGDILLGKAAIQYRRMRKWEKGLETLEKAFDLDPRNLLVLQSCAVISLAMRRHEESDRYLNQLISMAPDQIRAYQIKAWNEWLWKDTQTARRTLQKMPETGNPSSAFSWYMLELNERNYREALERLSSSPADSFVTHYWYYPKALLSGRAHDFLNEPELALAAYEEARLFLEKELQERPDDSRLHSSLGVAYAGLDRKEDAVREGERAVELLPVSKDAQTGTFRVHNLAHIYVMVGEYDEALDQIDTLLSIPAHFTVKGVELDPSFDPLREHPRYEEILEKYR